MIKPSYPLALAITFIAATSCTNSSFTGTSKKPQEKQSRDSNPRNTQETPINQTQTITPNNRVIAPYNETQDESEVTETTPVIDTTIATNSYPETQTIYTSTGSIKFNAVLFTNMEHKRHATDAGTYAVLKDSSDNLVGAGKITYTAATNGKNVGGLAYPVTQLNINLTKINSEAQSGSGKLSICQIQNTTSYECEKKQDNSERPVNWYDKEVSYKITNNDIVINNTAGIIGNGPGVAGGLSFAHPVAFVAVGAKVQQYSDFSSPITLDLNKNNKIDLISVNDSPKAVYFDHNGDGKKHLSGWVAKEDGLLALDIDGNQKITSGLELFGEHSHIEIKSKDKSKKIKNFNNGFLALAQYDDNQDGKIDKKDSIYRLLKVWRDKNNNGIGEKNELVSLKNLKIRSVNLKYQKNLNQTSKSYVVSKDNEIRLIGDYTDTTGIKHKLADVWFKADFKNSLSTK